MYVSHNQEPTEGSKSLTISVYKYNNNFQKSFIIQIFVGYFENIFRTNV